MDLQIRESKVDWLDIIEMALKKQDWGKTYVLYTYNKATISCVMSSFDFKRNEACFEIRLSYRDEDNWEHYEITHAFYTMKNFTIEDFKRLVKSKIVSRIRYWFDYLSKRAAEKKYSDLYYSYYSVKEEDFTKYGFKALYDSAMAIEDEEIREDFIDGLKEKLADVANKEYNNKVEEYMEKHPVIIADLEHIKQKLENEIL